MTISRNWRGIEHVTIEQLTAYLLEHGWQQIKYQNDRLKVFQLTNDDNFFMLPAYSSLSDFQPRMMEAIDRIAAVEDEATYVVLQRFAAMGKQSMELERRVDAQPGRELRSYLSDGRLFILRHGDPDGDTRDINLYDCWVYNDDKSITADLHWRGENIDEIISIGRKYKDVDLLDWRA